MGDRDTMRVAREILEYLFGSGKGPFGIHIPALGHRFANLSLECLGLGERAQIVPAKFQERLRGRPEEQVIHHSPVLPDDRIERVRQGEHDVNIGNGQKQLFLPLEPFHRLMPLAIGTMPVPAGSGHEMLPPAILAAVTVAAQLRGLAGQQRVEDFPVMRGKSGRLSRQRRAQHLSQTQPNPLRPCPSAGLHAMGSGLQRAFGPRHQIQGFLHCLQRLFADVQIPGRGGHTGVSEQSFDHVQRRSRFHQMRRPPVAQTVRPAFARQTRPFPCLLEGTLGGGVQQRFVRILPARKEPVLGVIGPPVATQFLKQTRRENAVAIFLSLPLFDADQHPARINVFDLQMTAFIQSQSGSIERHEKRPILARGKTVFQKRMHLLDAVGLGTAHRFAESRQRIFDAPQGPVEQIPVKEAQPVDRDVDRARRVIGLAVKVEEILANLFLTERVGRTTVIARQFQDDADVGLDRARRAPLEGEMFNEPPILGGINSKTGI